MTARLEKSESHYYFSIIGIVFGLIAFVLSVTSPWIESHFQPERKASIEDIAKDKAVTWKNKLVNKFTGKEEPDASETSSKHWTEYWPLLVIAVSVIGIAGGIIGFLRKEPIRIVLTAAGLGVSAIVLQYALVYVAIILAILLVIWFLNMIGASF